MAELGIPRSTLQYWLDRKDSIDADPNVINFFESTAGTAFLHRLVIGPRIPLYCSVLGKAILAQLLNDDFNQYIENRPFYSFTPHTITDPQLLAASLKNFNSKGYVMEKEEMIRGTVCIGSPLFDRNNKPIAALSLSSGLDQLRKNN